MSGLAPPALRGWRSLPRDARDTLFLLAVIGWTVLPHLPNLPAWCIAFAAAVLLWRGRLAIANAPLPSRWWLVAALGIAVALTAWSHGTLLGKEAGVTMAVVLMALKTLELRARRDAFVVFFLGFFLVLTHFFYSQSILTAIAMVGAVWGLLATLVLAHMPAGRPPLRLALAEAARAAALGAPVMALLFVLFPRIGPLWGVPQEMTAKTGLSGTMTMGGMAEVAQDESVAMRVRFIGGGRPPPQALYFRGPVLDVFDGREWRSSLPSNPPTQSLGEEGVAGPTVAYELTIEPLRLPVLPVLEMTVDPPQIDNDEANLRLTRRFDSVWVAQRPLIERVRVNAVARLAQRAAPVQGPRDLRDLVALPAGYNPRTLQWAFALRRDPRYAQADARALAQAVLQHIRSAGFSYTLAPGPYGENDPRATVDEFWLDRKAGFCEHFAAAFVVVMRAMDVPARVVTGYQGTDPFPVDGYEIVRQSHAHAWAEYWLPGTGWVRADPTAAVAPDRIERSRNLVPARGLVAGAIEAMSPNLLVQFRNAWEAVNNRWSQWVLNYSRGQQFELMKALGMRSPNWMDLLVALLVCASALAFGGALWTVWDRRHQDPWTRMHQRVRLKLRGLQVDAPAHAGIRTLVKHVRARYGASAQPLAESLLALEKQRYGRSPLRRPSPTWWREFSERARALASISIPDQAGATRR